VSFRRKLKYLGKTETGVEAESEYQLIYWRELKAKGGNWPVGNLEEHSYRQSWSSVNAQVTCRLQNKPKASKRSENGVIVFQVLRSGVRKKTSVSVLVVVVHAGLPAICSGSKGSSTSTLVIENSW
jgi:hypothetical protein